MARTGRKRVPEFSGPGVRLRQPMPAIPPERRADSFYPADSDEAAEYSDLQPATHSDFKTATIPS